MSNQLKSLLQKILFPQPEQCCFCLQKATRGGFCQRCWRQLSLAKKKEFCRKCGRILAHNQPCSECRGEQGGFNFARAVGEYQGIFQELLQQYKYTGKQSLAVPMGRLMADAVLADARFIGTQLIIPIPLALRKFAQRKFNQSELLAREIGSVLGLPVQAAVLRRVKDTLTQAKLSKSERQANLAGAFELPEAFRTLIKGKKLMLVDDVFTTGSTCSEAAKVLLANGAKEIAVLTWATGIAKDSKGKREDNEP